MDKQVYDVEKGELNIVPLNEEEIQRREEASAELLRLAKERKGNELGESCEKEIISGFDYERDGVIYHFSYDLEAQGNFRDARDAFRDGLILEIEWTVYVDGEYKRILLNEEDLNNLRLVALEHKDSRIKRYRNELLPLLEGATTVEDIEAIKW